MDNNHYITSSPYRRGAVYGAPFGLYLTALFFAISYTFDHQFLGLVSFAMMLGVPVLIYVFLRRSFVEDRGTTIYSSLWMEGIAIFFFGGLISTLVAVVYMRWIEPDFIESRIDAIIALYEQADFSRSEEAIDILTRAREQNLIPKPIDIAVDMLWFIVFTGSMLSMLMALLARARGYKFKTK